MADQITDADIATAALEPAEITDDAGGVKQRPISELIDAQRQQQANAAAAQPLRGMRLTKLLPPGAT